MLPVCPWSLCSPGQGRAAPTAGCEPPIPLPSLFHSYHQGQLWLSGGSGLAWRCPPLPLSRRVVSEPSPSAAPHQPLAYPAQQRALPGPDKCCRLLLLPRHCCRGGSVAQRPLIWLCLHLPKCPRKAPITAGEMFPCLCLPVAKKKKRQQKPSQLSTGSAHTPMCPTQHPVSSRAVQCAGGWCAASSLCSPE